MTFLNSFSIFILSSLNSEPSSSDLAPVVDGLADRLWLRWALAASVALSRWGSRQGLPSVGASHCGGLSYGARASAAAALGSVVAASGFQSTGLAAMAQRLRCSKACGDLPRPGIEPMPPAWACGFFPTEPPRKSTHCDFVRVRCL